MDNPSDFSTDLESVAKQLNLPVNNVQATVELLDEGNTVPFVTRYRKDRTGGLDEEQIRSIHSAVDKQRQLTQRKQKIVKSIQSQEKLTNELREKILAAKSLKTLEDLYLPYKPKKQTLATIARQRGLEPLAQDVLGANPLANDFKNRCQEFVNAELELLTPQDVETGVRHLLAEHFSEQPELRSLLRRHMWAGKITSKRIERTDEELELDAAEGGLDAEAEPTQNENQAAEGDPSPADDDASTNDDAITNGTSAQSPDPASESQPGTPDVTESVAPNSDENAAPESVTTESTATEEPSPAEVLQVEDSPVGDAAVESPETDSKAHSETDSKAHSESAALESQALESQAVEAPSVESTSVTDVASSPTESPESTEDAPSESNSTENAEATDASESGSVANAPAAEPNKKGEAAVGSDKPLASEKSKKPGKTVAQTKSDLARQRREMRREVRKRKRHKLEQSFKDYFNFDEPIKKLPHYRTLALNRGERSKVLRIRIDFNLDAAKRESEEKFVNDSHPHATLLRECVGDALTRSVIPSIEREIRRELTDKAEAHAVRVFARNLRKLLLQSPLQGHRILAVDPGFKSGCKLVALDEFGNVLGHSLVHVIGSSQRVEESRARFVEEIKKFQIDVVAIGNGTACRETEQMVAQIIRESLPDQEVGYLIVNEAGASVYSTSHIGREELPKFDATVRGAVSIGRRTLDPLSELVKIDPANIGVGLYQHDVKAKHLRDSLDTVVESCVNYVGVDVNSASPALLGYVSGLNQLTARRVYEFRREHGPLKSREQLKEIPGVGEATFVQAAGFLRIPDGENPLDGTWIHPESYNVANRVLEAIGCDASELRPAKSAAPAEAPVKAVSEARVSSFAQTAAEPPAAEPPAAESPAAESPAAESPAAEVTAAELPTSVSATQEASTNGDAAAETDEAPETTTPPEATPPELPLAETSLAETSLAETTAATSASTTAGPDSASVAVTADANTPESSTAPETLEASSSQEATETIDASVEVAPESPASDASTSDAPTAEVATAETANIDSPPNVETAEQPANQPAAQAPIQAQPINHQLVKKLEAVDIEKLAKDLNVGKMLLKDILLSLARPGRDPRDDVSPPVFRREIMKLENLKPGMQLTGTVLNVVDFGAFLDIGLTDSGLIHVSRLSDRFISDPHDIVSVGDILTAWVVDVDEKRRRVSLTAIKPGTEKPKPEKRAKETSQNRPSEGAPKGKRVRRDRDKPRGGGKPADRKKTNWQPKKAAPKPVVPLTDAMVEGKEPMRTFSDLLQFYDGQRDSGDKKSKKDKPKEK